MSIKQKYIQLCKRVSKNKKGFIAFFNNGQYCFGRTHEECFIKAGKLLRSLNQDEVCFCIENYSKK